jgi:hypothetical protein
VIRVRYRDLPPGLNGDAVREGDNVVVYFAPGLTAQQRKAVLRRLRQAASRGQKPPLPTAPLALALVTDRLRAKVSTVVAIVRLHPAGTVVPMFGLATLIGMFFLTSVSVHIVHDPPATAGQPGVLGGGLPPAIPSNTVRPAAHVHRVVSGGSQADGNGAQTQVTGSPDPVPAPASSGSQGSPGNGSSTGSSPGVPGGTPGGGGTPAPTPGSSPGGVISAQVKVAPSSVAVRASVGSAGGVCVHLGPFGICLSI